MSFEKRDRFDSSFLICMPFISFTCLIALASASSTMFNTSSENGHPCLISDIRGKTRYLHQDKLDAEP